MFTSIQLKNFKAYRESPRVPLRPLTLILGANNSGKSSLLHAVLLLAQTVEDSASRQALVTSGAYIDLGGYFDIIWSGQNGKAQTFGVKLGISEDSVSKAFLGPEEEDVPGPTELDVAFALDADKNAIVVSSVSITGGDVIFASARRSGRGYAAPHLSDIGKEQLELNFRHFLPNLVPKVSVPEIERDVMNAYFAAEKGWFSWSNVLQRVAHVAPLREPIPRFGILGKSLTSELGPGGENLLRVLRAEDNQSSSGERLATEVSSWVSENFKMLHDLRLVDVDEAGTVLALLGDEREGVSGINVANMGEGISQLLPIIARVLTTPPKGSLLIEQPELHLHPAAQADLADLFIAAAAKGNRQYIVETHSEHLLLRLRRRIAEGQINPRDVAILYVERQGSESAVRALDLDDVGQFDDWPEGFFDERYRESLAIAEIIQQRRE